MVVKLCSHTPTALVVCQERNSSITRSLQKGLVLSTHAKRVGREVKSFLTRHLVHPIYICVTKC